MVAAKLANLAHGQKAARIRRTTTKEDAMPKLCRFDAARSESKYINPMLVRAITRHATSNYTIIEFANNHTVNVDLPIEEVAGIIDAAMME
jgi:hypothetical protein